VDEESTSAGDPMPPGCVLIEVRLAELKRLFNAIDPSPFRERDLDPAAEEFIVEWAKEAPRDAQFALLVHLDRPAGPDDEPVALRDAIREFFTHRADVTFRRVRQLMRVGRTSLVIGLAFLAAAVVASDLLATALPTSRLANLLRESVLIGGWVAMWRPLQIFLYDWWPIRAEGRLYRRLAAMPVRIAYGGDGLDPAAWRHDWPTVPAHSGSTTHV